MRESWRTRNAATSGHTLMGCLKNPARVRLGRAASAQWCGARQPHPSRQRRRASELPTAYSSRIGFWASSTCPVCNVFGRDTMPLKLYIHPCIHRPHHHLHPPPFNCALRIRIQGPLESIEKLLPTAPWRKIGPFPQQGGLELARLTQEALYGKMALEGADFSTSSQLSSSTDY